MVYQAAYKRSMKDNVMDSVIKPDSTVVMHYVISLDDGTVVDGSRGEQPLRVTLGDGTLINGLEQALQGLKRGDSRLIRLEPVDAYGFRDEENVHDLVRSEFASNLSAEPEPGQIIGFTTPSGDEVPGTVIEVTDEHVVVDLNHPLAGRSINFDVHILDVISSH